LSTPKKIFKIQKSNNEAQIFKYINYPLDTCGIHLGVMAGLQQKLND
jgi:hypothetical protein